MKYFKKYPLLVAMITLIAIILVVGLFTGQSLDNFEDSVTQSTLENPGPTDIVVGNEDGTQVNYVGVAGESALDTLRGHFDIKTNSFDFGEFVTAINDVEATDGENFWALYINGQQASVGADSYIAEEGDAIEWRLEDIE